ncbi:SKP1 component [Macleaya cordata]|uniref:SKP1-like protein n=1 Tax=Macleaya cordata TaxID=56857 RepID=A0A200QR76_MACCD|nr:SKP1 component [Macleaya cordata]
MLKVIQSITLKQKVTLRSCDEETFEIDESVILQSNMIQYCQKHIKDDQQQKQQEEQEEIVKEELVRWDKQFMMKMDKKRVSALLMAADYMEIEDLIDLKCRTIADMIKDMTVEQVRHIFDIENDFTPEEEERIRNE